MKKGDIVLWRESHSVYIKPTDVFHLGIVTDVLPQNVFEVRFGSDRVVLTSETRLFHVDNVNQFTILLRSQDIFTGSTASLLNDLMKELDTQTYKTVHDYLWDAYTPEGDQLITEGLIGGAYQTIFKALLEILHKQ